MMAKAIGPQNTVGRDRDHAEHGGDRRQHQRPQARAGGADDRVQTPLPAARSVSIWIDQDHRVLGDHADQREDAEDRDEAERPAGQQQRRDHADQSERQHADDHRQAPEALPAWTIRKVSISRIISGTTAKTESLRRRALLGDAAGLDAVGRRQPASNSSMCGASASTTSSGRTPGDDVGEHRQGRHAVAPPDERVLLLVDEGRRTGCSGTVRPLGVGTCSERSVVNEMRSLAGRAGHDVDEVDVVAHLGDGRAGHRGVQDAAPERRELRRAAAPGPGRRACAAAAPAPSSRS